jgi:hypothetical protein
LQQDQDPVLCEMIAERKQHANLDKVMCPMEFEDQENHDDGGDGKPDDKGEPKQVK